VASWEEISVQVPLVANVEDGWTTAERAVVRDGEVCPTE